MYTYKIEGQTLSICKITYDSGKVYWYYDVNNSGDVNDHYLYKRSAKAAGVEFINENF
tara:strand:+ start:84 stop:257 length:174 start_codon:yes stop_codon:yes gene_type:complete